ncbi:MAG TPA: SIMPL domain-containing protein [Bryobacteraceae bacterium]|nr:SIMPL domain-containing protein [Bryobacteraceae bacterium]HZW91904.1 SIMPL domain-containing protein [Candidatus Eremiobacteraceae bacterium]
MAKPDQAVVEIGVISQGATAVAAAAQNAKQTDVVLADLSSALGGTTKLKTTSYSVQPNYRYPKPGAALEIAGYTATNVLEVKLDDLVQVGKVIDGATHSGANVIRKLEYKLKDPSAVRGEALRKAAEQAKASVEAIALGLGLRVVRVLSAEEVTSEEGFGSYKKAPPPPPPGGTTTPATQLEVGAIEVGASVIVRAEIGQ